MHRFIYFTTTAPNKFLQFFKFYAAPSTRRLFPGLVVGQPFSTALSPVPFAACLNIYDDDDDLDYWEPSSILHDHGLLRKSKKTTSLVTTSRSGLHVLDLINSGSLQPDRALYRKLLQQCTQLGKIKEGRIVHAHLRNSSFSNDITIQNTILNMYAKCGCLDDAHNLFGEMPSRDYFAWTALITGYSQNDRPEDALHLFPKMLHLGLKPNNFTLSSLLKASGDTGPNPLHGKQIHAFCLKYGYCSNVFVGSSLVYMYTRCTIMDDAESAFNELAFKNEVSWNGLISGYSRKGEGERAIKLFWEMLREGFKPTHSTYASVFSGCASIGALEQGKWVHAYMLKSGEELIAYVGHTLLDMYAKSGSIEDAMIVFDRLVKRNVVSWNSMLAGFAQHGFGKLAITWFRKMLKTSAKPDEITFVCVLTACSHAGLLDEGIYFFNLMKTYKLVPQIPHYVAFVDLLGRAGHLDQAYTFIRDLAIKPTATVWGALLGACWMHKNMELGVYAAQRVFELDPHDSGSHMLLFNIYASAGRWNEAAEVRKMMKESGVKKEPACSWVEIENVAHMFVASDNGHPHIEEIHNMWEKMFEKIKEIGYVPDASNVLLFVNQKEREERLQRHSEKLALAFALLKTPPGSTIRIKKNIRVCGDCHSAIKFVSKVVNRTIIVRDINRFHHFCDGFCSCGDYW